MKQENKLEVKKKVNTDVDDDNNIHSNNDDDGNNIS